MRSDKGRAVAPRSGMDNGRGSRIRLEIPTVGLRNWELRLCFILRGTENSLGSVQQRRRHREEVG